MFRFNLGFGHVRIVRGVALGITILALSLPVAAQSGIGAEGVEQAVVACSERDSNLQRLECYDALADRLIQNSPRARAPRLTESSVAAPQKVKPAPKKASVKLESRREVRLKSGKNLRPELRIECGERSSLAVHVGVKLPVGKVAVNTRVDKEEVVKELWSVSPDRTGVLAPSGDSIATRMRGAQILEVKVSPRKSEPIPFSFELEPLHRECGDTIP